MTTKFDDNWEQDCIRYQGVVLMGECAHRCPDWDGMPVDETCIEFGGCNCWHGDLRADQIRNEMAQQLDDIILDGDLWEEWHDEE